MTIGKNIKKIRTQHGLSQKEFAIIAGVSDKAVSSWENDIKEPRMGVIQKIADHFGMQKSNLIEDNGLDAPIVPTRRQGVRIPVLGKVVAGIPIEAITDILDYEEIDPDLAKTGEFFALQVQGESMEPTLREGDIVIVRRQPCVESGETAIVLVNGNDATVKQVKEMPAGIMLIGHNTAVYEPHFYSQQEIEDLPVQILGKVVELRRKF